MVRRLQWYGDYTAQWYDDYTTQWYGDYTAQWYGDYTTQWYDDYTTQWYETTPHSGTQELKEAAIEHRGTITVGGDCQLEENAITTELEGRTVERVMGEFGENKDNERRWQRR